MKELVPVLVSTSCEFLPYCAVMIWSVLQHGAQDITYRFHVCHHGIQKEAQERLLDWFAGWQNCEIAFTDITEWDHGQYAALDWTGRETYIGLLAPELFPQYEKMILLDVDLVVLRDIAQLYRVPLGDHFIAAALDPDFIGQWRSGNKEYHRCYSQIVPLQNPMEYIQAGVILMNLAAFRIHYPAPFFIQKVEKSAYYKFDDQDLFNLYCQGHILFFDMRWNVLHDNHHYRQKYVISLAPRHIYEAYLLARKDPWIVHFAGDQKPWNDPTCDYGRIFWDIAQKSPVPIFSKAPAAKSPNKRRLQLLRNCYYRARLLWQQCYIALCHKYIL